MSPADEIDAIFLSTFPKDDKIDVTAALDVYDLVSGHMTALERRLAANGHKLTSKADPRTVPVKTKIGHWTPAQGLIEQEITQHQRCHHTLITIDEEAAVLECRTCGLLVNPIWWIARHHKEVSRAAHARRALLEEAQLLTSEVESLKAERNKHRQAVRRGKESTAKRALNDSLPPALAKKKRA